MFLSVRACVLQCVRACVLQGVLQRVRAWRPVCARADTIAVDTVRARAREGLGLALCGIRPARAVRRVLPAACGLRVVPLEAIAVRGLRTLIFAHGDAACPPSIGRRHVAVVLRQQTRGARNQPSSPHSRR